MDYPLYDVPYLVRDPNEYRMSEKRHQTEVRNQAVVDDYFIARDKGASAHEAREVVAEKHGITPEKYMVALFGTFKKPKEDISPFLIGNKKQFFFTFEEHIA